jgi:hypothetical protein
MCGRGVAQFRLIAVRERGNLDAFGARQSVQSLAADPAETDKAEPYPVSRPELRLAVPDS